ncbi:MAG: EamA family transporter [Bacteroidetes bacterium HGW-Bacteroidetes-1]|jgi:drug/metabolite transporter (DMT)-like permease|nr:MAG: EamA family transporter [Bacteroidetes bacterium HGW-Bacteroidetes-1]
MKNQRKAYLFALLSVAFWSTMSTAFKLSLGFIAFDLLLFWSVLFAIAILGFILVFQGRLNELKHQSKQEIARSALMGLLNPFGYYLILFKAYELLQAQEAGVLNYTWPIVLVVLSVPFLGQRIGWMGFIAIFLSFAGLVVISTKGKLSGLEFTNPPGVALAVGSAFLWALYWIINMRDKREALSKIFINMLFGGAYITLYMLLFSSITIPVPKALLGAIYIGSFEMGITFVFWLLALKYSTNTAKVSNLIFLSPFIALFFIRIFVGEQILLSTIIGLVLIVGGILLQQIEPKKLKRLWKKDKPNIV